MKIEAETLDHVTATIDRIVAVADFAKHGAITDERAANSGFYTDEGLGSPETLLYGPEGDFEHGCDVAGAWQGHTELCSGDVEYHVSAHNAGSMTMCMRIPAADLDAAPVELTIGMNDRIGLHADPLTITALGGTPSHPVTGIAASEIDHDTGMPVDLQNLHQAGVSAGDRDRLWTALNEASHTHPDAPQDSGFPSLQIPLAGVPPPKGAGSPAGLNLPARAPLHARRRHPRPAGPPTDRPQAARARTADTAAGRRQPSTSRIAGIG